jgi:competence protein ComEC
MQSPPSKNPQPAGLLVIWWPVFLSIGIGSFFLWPEGLGGVHSGLRLCALSFMVYMWPVSWRNDPHRPRWAKVWHWFKHGLAATSLGLALMQIQYQRIDITPLDYPVYGRLVTGTIEKIDYIDGGWRVVLDEVTIAPHHDFIQKPNVILAPTHYRVRVAIRHADFKPEIGQKIAVKASLIPPSFALLPGMFDFRRHAYLQNLSGYGYSMSPVTILSETEITPQLPWHTLLERYRYYLSERVTFLMQDDYFTPQQSVVGLTMALLNGQRAGIDKVSSADMQRSGLQHLISISGYHVSLMAGIIFFAVRFLLALSMRITLRYPIKKIAAFVAMIGIILYMCVVGFTAPTVRSVIMSGVVLFAIMLDREAITLRVVALSASLILLIDPSSLITPGFQMSFAAVAGLVVFYQKTRHWWFYEFWRRNILTRILMILAGSIATTMVATITTAPFAVYHFQQLPILSVVANILVTPVMSFIVMPASILVYLTIMFDGLGHITLWFMGYGVEKILHIAAWVSQSDFALWRMRGLQTPHVVLMTLGGLWMMSVKTCLAWWGIIPIVIAMIASSWTPRPVMALLPTEKRTIIYAPLDQDVIYHEGRLDKFSKDLLMQFLVKHKTAPLTPDIPLPPDIYIARDIADLEHICDRPESIIVTRWYVDDHCQTQANQNRSNKKGKTIIDRFALQETKTGLVVLEK